MAKKTEPVYCTPDDVAETLDLPDPNDHYGSFTFSAMSHPSYLRVCKMIKSNEDIVDRTVRRSWKECRVTDQVLTIMTYWHDINAWRTDYYQEGGNYVQLRKNVLPWDPSKGDKLEFKTRQNTWIDISNFPNMTHAEARSGDNMPYITGVRFGFWFDYNLGKLYLRTSMFQNLAHSVRISYRYGQEVPYQEADQKYWTYTDEGGFEEAEEPAEDDTREVIEVGTDEDNGGIPRTDNPKEGVLYYTPYKTDEYNQIKIDREALEVPEGINRMCCLMTAIQVLSMQFFNVKVGASGDIGDAKNAAIRAWTDEINMLKTSFQRSGSVHSLYR